MRARGWTRYQNTFAQVLSLYSGDKGHRYRDPFVSWAHPTGNKGQMQRTGSRIHPDAVVHPTVARERSFKSRYCRPRGKSTLRDHVLYSSMYLITNRCVVVLEIDKWYETMRCAHGLFPHLTQYPSRIASDDGPGCNVMGDDTPGADSCPLANGHPTEDDRS